MAGDVTPTAGAYAGSFAFSPSSQLSPPTSPTNPFNSALSSFLSALPPLSTPPDDHLYIGSAVPIPSTTALTSPPSSSSAVKDSPPPPPLPPPPFYESALLAPSPMSSPLPPPAVKIPTPTPPVPRRVAPSPVAPPPFVTAPTTPSVSSHRRLPTPTSWTDVARELLASRRMAELSISSAQSVHMAAFRQQVRSVHTSLLKNKHELDQLKEEAAQAKGRLQEAQLRSKTVKTLTSQLEGVDGSLVALLNRRRTAITKEQAALFARIDSLLSSGQKLNALSEPMMAGLMKSMQDIKRGVLVSRVADALRKDEEEKELREAYDGHLPKLVTTDTEQTQSPRWGEMEGWTIPEPCIRYSMTLVDEGKSARSNDLVGPFRLKENPQSRVIRMRTDPFGEGAMRLAYLCEDVTDCPVGDFSSAIRLVAKESRWRKDYKGVMENRREFYTGDISAQLLAQQLVERFNALSPPKMVQMLTPMLYEFPQRSDPDRRFMLMELCLLEHGEFQRYTDNESWRNPSFETMMALSHWSHTSTQGKFMLCDLQGVGYLLTDPQIHSLDDSWGQGDIGEEGMKNFYTAHYCNDLCRKMQLRPHPAQPTQRPDDFIEGETKAKETYNSKVIGMCGHVFELTVKERKGWLKAGQQMLCTACNTAKAGTTKSFFGR